MHDPKTLAFEIYLGPKKKKNGHYRSPLISIWHSDPETDGTDDSCGWTFPKITKEEKKWLDEVAKDQYPQLFARKIALLEDKSYASVCYNQDTYGVIYWMWRHFNRKVNKAVWQYGKPLSNIELQFVYELATNPVDNFQSYKCENLQAFREMIGLVFRSWKRFHRKWYQHPKWHIHHWEIQLVFIRDIKRRYFDKCSICGKRGFETSAYSDWSGSKIWCHSCNEKTMRPVISNPHAQP